MPTAAALLCDATRRLRAAGVEEPRAEARLLLRHATGWSRERLVGEPLAAVPETARDRFEALIAARAERVPAAYLLGTREFWGLAVDVRPGVLVPRPETETLVEAALAAFPDRAAALRILDLGTGSACLLVALLSLYPRAGAVGTDLSAEALAVARLNLERYALAGRALLVQTHWAAAIAGPFDLIVANPPYVESAALDALAPEVARHEPRLALDGGPDGLAAFRALTPDLLRLLGPDGVACLEIGRGQASALRRWLAAHGFAVEPSLDLAGIERCLVVRRPGGTHTAGG